jgi:hypothetical protein
MDEYSLFKALEEVGYKDFTVKSTAVESLLIEFSVEGKRVGIQVLKSWSLPKTLKSVREALSRAAERALLANTKPTPFSH